VSTTPVPLLRLLADEREVLRVVVLRFDPLLDRLALFFAAGLRALVLPAPEREVLERFVLLRGVLAAIEISSSGVQIRWQRPTRSARQRRSVRKLARLTSSERVVGRHRSAGRLRRAVWRHRARARGAP
jgi:hypothetical protein